MHITKNTLWQTSSMNDTKNFPIDWRYLTFDTEIPAQQISAADESSEDSSAQLSLCQDLAIYASPKTWSDSRKRIITWTSCTATVFTGFAAGSYSSGFDQMAQEWKVGDIALSVGITVFTFGIGSAPMFLAPFSEINGRRPVFMIAGGSFVLFQLCCAITHTYWGMIVSRFLTGCASSTFSTVVAGVVSDIYDTEHRNTAMALFSGASLLGSGLGPLVSGFVAMRTTWRWIFYAQVISCGGLMILMMIIFRETRGPVLLSRKAKALNQWYDNLERLGYQCVARHTSNETDGHDDVHRIRWKVRYDEERGSVMRMIKTSICRPVYLLFTEPIVFLFSLWISFSWAVLYATFAAIPLVFRSSHDSMWSSVAQCLGLCVSQVYLARYFLYSRIGGCVVIYLALHPRVRQSVVYMFRAFSQRFCPSDAFGLAGQALPKMRGSYQLLGSAARLWGFSAFIWLCSIILQTYTTTTQAVLSPPKGFAGICSEAFSL